MSPRVTEGSPEPLGATPTLEGVNFAVYSSTAAAVEVCLFDAQDRETRVRLTERTGDVFHGHVEGIGEGARYGLRAHGAFAPEKGMRFDAAKLLVDPYAVALDRPFILHPSLFALGADSAAVMPKAVVTAPAPPAAPPLTIPWDRTVIYEAHVRGLTRLHPDVPEAIRGTFAALAHPAIIAHLKTLGVTTLELLPTAAWIDERHLPPLGLTNYWGYNPVCFCVPDPRLAPGGWAEVRAATAALAEAGIETVLDVVFNHTGEGDALGPTLSLRGLDNAGYYRLRSDDPSRYVDDSGTGNTLALDRPRNVRLAMEALRAWARRGGVSGFRFDLATILARRADGFDHLTAPFLAALYQDPELRCLKRIAEPWDCGPGGYQFGRFPGAWAEWNDGFRDDVRRFWRGDRVSLGALASRLAGSQPDLGARRRPSRSINFITAHDGFTLADLVAYGAKHNEANGEANRDGTDNNGSWNNGVEGPTHDPAITGHRLADQRALLATLVLARGTPMLSMGSELGQSQGGNNNAYAQDNAVSWIDWAKADAGLEAFAARLVQARAAHPALRADHFLTGQPQGGPWPDVTWRKADGAPLTAADWDDPEGSALQMTLAVPGEDPGRVTVILNRGARALPCVLCPPRDGQAWRIELDSADVARDGVLADQTLELAPRSVVLAVETPAPTSPRRGAPDTLLAEVAEAAGIAPEWWSLDGERHAVSAQTRRALLAAMDLPAETVSDAQDSLWRLAQPDHRPLPGCIVRRQGEAIVLPVRAPDAWLTVEVEDGVVARVRIEDGAARLPPLPPGRHRLRLDGGEQGRLIVAPAAAFRPPALKDGGRLWGLSAQLYALQRQGDQGIGDFTTLGILAEGAAARGANMIGLNPLHALFPAQRERASPYHPSDRRFLDPIYLDVQTEPDSARALSGQALIDYPVVWALKSQALEALAPTPSPGFDAFVAAGGQALADFAAFQTIAETYPGWSWTQWPEALHSPRSPDVAAFAAAHPERVRHHLYLQWLCEQQFAAAAERARGLALGFCRDLAVGAAPDGAEAWAGSHRLAMAVSIGAPPDAFSPKGQVWALPPPIPRRWTEEGYDSFAELLRANMRHAGALRIDHVLGLERLFWVPEGAEGGDGAYVAYPREDLLGVLALESVRAGCLVVGEDLGTVPEGLRAALGENGVFSYKVLPFERDETGFRPPADYPAEALACVATHDLPPLRGWWEGADIDERAALGLLADAAAEKAQREADKALLLAALAEAGLVPAGLAPNSPTPGPLTPELAGAIHAYVASSPAGVALVQAEDLAGERVGVNLPGTDRERPNWRRRIEPPVEQLWDAEPATAIVAALKKARPLSQTAG
jgi:glycogen debranching enzyme GlgX/4-alpha-glucanotransferase